MQCFTRLARSDGGRLDGNMDPRLFAERADLIAQTKKLLALARDTRAAARNLRHTAVLRRAVNKLMHSGDPRQWTRIWTHGRVTPSSEQRMPQHPTRHYNPFATHQVS